MCLLPAAVGFSSPASLIKVLMLSLVLERDLSTTECVAHMLELNPLLDRETENYQRLLIAYQLTVILTRCLILR